ncbi:MAG: hypothetical protein ACHQ51_09150 [Elusimicrobiota bacterium]
MTKARAALGLAAALALLGAWHLVLRGQGRGVPLITDEGEYAVAARVWSEGGLPYRDAFSQKPPTTFLIYRLAAALSPAPTAPRALAALAVVLTMLALFACAPTSWSAAGRLAGPAAYAALSSIPVGDFGFPANTEIFLNLFASLSAAALLRGSPLLAGLAAGTALTTKQTALWTVVGFGALSGATPRGFSAPRAARFAAGAALVPAAWGLYFGAHGALGVYWSSAWAGNARYAAVLARSGMLNSQLSWFFSMLLPRLFLFSLPAAVLAGWSLKGLRAGAKRPVETLAVVWFATAVAGALTGLFLFPHYFVQAAPGLALGAACGVEKLSARRVRFAPAAAAALALWPALIAPRAFFASSARQRGLALLYPNPLFETKVMGEEIARRAAPGDFLHVFGSEGALFAYSGLMPATRHTLCYALTLFPEDARGWRDEMSALEAAPPRFIVYSTQPLSTMTASTHGLDYAAGMRAMLARRYRYAGGVRVTDSAELPVYADSPAGVPAPYEEEDRLFLFERNF